MDVRDMRQLLAIREHGSLAKAAHALGMAQPSLSKSINRLEDQLKVRIVERSASGSVLTPVGEILADRAAKVVAEARQLLQDAELLGRGDTGLVRLGISTALRGEFLKRLCRRIVAAHPDLRLDIEVLDRGKLVPALYARELDVIFCSVGDEVHDETLACTELFATRGVAVAAPEHPLAKVKGLSVEALSQFRGVGNSAPSFTMVDAFPGLPTETELAFYASNDPAALVELACAADAVLVTGDFVVLPLLAEGKLVRLDIDTGYSVSFAAMSARAASFSPIINKITRYALAIGQDLQAEWARLDATLEAKRDAERLAGEAPVFAS